MRELNLKKAGQIIKDKRLLQNMTQQEFADKHRK